MMETINELKEKIHFYKLTIQDMKEHYGEFEMETNQEIKDLKHEIEELNKEINKEMALTTEYESKYYDEYDKNKELKAKIDKAVEYIYECAYDSDRKVQVDDMWEEIPKLLEILKGEKENG